MGGFAVQLARLHGAQVIATASGRNRDFVAGLGAHEVIDYRESRFEECVRQLDAVFDSVGGDTLARSWSVLKPGGRMVTVASSAADSGDARVKQAFFIVEPSQKQLEEVGALLDAGKLRTFVDMIVPLSEAPEAYAGTLRRQGRGKMVVVVESKSYEQRSPNQMNRDALNHQEVEDLAYRLWQERGSPIGSPEIDWFRAEEELAGRWTPDLAVSAFSMGPTED